jgi:di/tricarboxylate transporter
MGFEAWAALGWDAWVTLAVAVIVLGMLVFTQYGADLVLVAGVTVLVLTGVLDTKQAFAGMANEGMLTVAVLYVVAAALDSTGATGWVVQKFLRRPKSTSGAIVRLMAPVSFMSAWLNNTPVVAMFMPAVNDWARQNRIPPSKLMIPLSYAAVLGGCITLIGTSTNLIVHGLLLKTNTLASTCSTSPGWACLARSWALGSSSPPTAGSCPTADASSTRAATPANTPSRCGSTRRGRWSEKPSSRPGCGTCPGASWPRSIVATA